jgi:hypothetical protein
VWPKVRKLASDAFPAKPAAGWVAGSLANCNGSECLGGSEYRQENSCKRQGTTERKWRGMSPV